MKISPFFFMVLFPWGAGAGQMPIITNNPKDYLFLTDVKSREAYFRKGSIIKVPASILCKELNDLHSGEANDLRNQNIKVLIGFYLECKKNDSNKIELTLINPKGELLRHELKVKEIYFDSEDMYSFITDTFLFKVHVWNSFNDRAGIVRMIIFDQKNKNILNISKPLKKTKLIL